MGKLRTHLDLWVKLVAHLYAHICTSYIYHLPLSVTHYETQGTICREFLSWNKTAPPLEGIYAGNNENLQARGKNTKRGLLSQPSHLHSMKSQRRRISSGNYFRTLRHITRKRQFLFSASWFNKSTWKSIMLRQVGKSDIDQVPGNTEELLLSSGWDTEPQFCGMDSSQVAKQLETVFKHSSKRRG